MGSIDARIKKNGFINGIILGVLVLAVSVLSFYFIINMPNSKFAIMVGPLLFSVVIPLALAVFLTIRLRSNFDYWTFKEAVTGIFIMFFTAYVLLTIGRDVLFVRLVEPNMVQKTENAMVSSTTTILKISGYSEKQIIEKTTDLKKSFDEGKNPTIGKIIQGFIITIIFLFVGAIIFGAVFKKEPPILTTEV